MRMLGRKDINKISSREVGVSRMVRKFLAICGDSARKSRPFLRNL